MPHVFGFSIVSDVKNYIIGFTLNFDADVKNMTAKTNRFTDWSNVSRSALRMRCVSDATPRGPRGPQAETHRVPSRSDAT